jgi:D-alanyl-D-alanine carboxypeptidase/D-alanyl-D-alanine-endopeptidase (penicillin-binding protein 4)
MTDAGGRMLLAPRVHLTIALLATVILGACHGAPPKIVPPPPAVPRITELQQNINAILAAPALERGTWGVVVKSLQSDETLYALNVHRLMMPASTQKILTLAVAADQLGWDFTYRTSVLTIGRVEDGALKGDVVVVGSGDPTFDDWDGFATARFAEWAAVLKRLGIHRVEGRIVGDDNAFDDEGLGAGWAWDDLAASFATGVGALQFNQNTAQLVITPSRSGEPVHVQVTPDAAHLSVLNRTSTGAGAPLTVRPIPHSPTIELDGTVAPTSARVLRNVSVPNPTTYFANAVRDGLIRNGVDVVGPAVDIDDLDAPLDRSNAVLSTEISSKGLTAIAGTMMKMSQNLYAETLLKTIGVHASGVGSTAAGRAVLDSTLANWGVATGEVLEVDGSGLSRYNLVTADALATVLRHVYQDERLRDPFIGTLPRAGVDGTLGDRMKGTAAADNVRAKTGSFSNARSVAGYLRTADGEPLEFVIIANNYGASASVIDNATDAILVALANFSRRQR